jgi:hypothetical protein
VNFYSLLVYIEHNGDESPKDAELYLKIRNNKNFDALLHLVGLFTVRTDGCVSLSSMRRNPGKLLCLTKANLFLTSECLLFETSEGEVFISTG